MANTLKFGNGEWYGKKDTILAYNDLNSNYKPLPFNFSRDSKATVVNKDGLIEEVGSGQPRIDYKDDSKGALLLEPSRTNLINYSEDFTSSWFWTKDNTTVTSGFLAPDGTNNAFKLTENNATSKHRVYTPNLIVSNGATLTTSIFVKSAERSWFLLQESTTDYGYYFNNGQVGIAIGSPLSYKIDELANGWYRYSITTVTPNTNGRLKLNIVKEDGGSTDYQGNGTSGIYIFGAQVEVGYSTSYIPTQGTVQTRLADSCNNSANEQVINSTEGVLYAEVAGLADGGDTRAISIFSAGDNRITLSLHSTTNRVQFYIAMNGYVNIVDLDATDIIQTNMNKIACKFKANDYALWINGVEKDTNTIQGNTIQSGTLNSLDFDVNGSNPFYGNVKDVKLYNTALTDAELIALTQV